MTEAKTDKINIAKEQYLQISLKNYDAWALRIMVFLAKNELWHYYSKDESGSEKLSTKEPDSSFTTAQEMLASGIPIASMKTLDIFLSTIDQDMLNELTVANKISAPEIWKYLQKRMLKTDLSAKTNAILDLTNFCYSEATMQDNKTALLEIQKW
jgi:hypothetical protein